MSIHRRYFVVVRGFKVIRACAFAIIPKLQDMSGPPIKDKYCFAFGFSFRALNLGVGVKRLTDPEEDATETPILSNTCGAQRPEYIYLQRFRV